MIKRITLFIAAALAVAVIGAPAQAKGPGTHSKKCVPHNVSYRVWGALTVPGALVANSDGTYTGTLTVQVKRTNKHAKADKGATVVYTLTNAKVKFGHGVDKIAPAIGTKAYLKGTITYLPKKCGTSTPTITIKKVQLHQAHK
jgi:hypothetical protein